MRKDYSIISSMLGVSLVLGVNSPLNSAVLPPMPSLTPASTVVDPGLPLDPKYKTKLDRCLGTSETDSEWLRPSDWLDNSEDFCLVPDNLVYADVVGDSTKLYSDDLNTYTRDTMDVLLNNMIGLFTHPLHRNDDGTINGREAEKIYLNHLGGLTDIILENLVLSETQIGQLYLFAKDVGADKLACKFGKYSAKVGEECGKPVPKLEVTVSYGNNTLGDINCGTPAMNGYMKNPNMAEYVDINYGNGNGKMTIEEAIKAENDIGLPAGKNVTFDFSTGKWDADKFYRCSFPKAKVRNGKSETARATTKPAKSAVTPVSRDSTFEPMGFTGCTKCTKDK